MTFLSYVIILMCYYCVLSVSEELWEQDLSDEMKIGPTTEGYKSVDLRCSPEHMEVTITTEKDFDGVIYTRGSYATKKLPCFRNLKSGTYFRMNIPFDDCKTTNENGLYKNVIIVQHDDDFIMPGDAAFDLECDFRKPKDIPLHTSVATDKIDDVISRIMLADADPGGKQISKEERLMATNKSNIVTFNPRMLVQNKRDEL